jgi:sulfatase modifying factor 1
MVWVPGGTFAMGSVGFYPEEGPVHQAIVEGLWVDLAPVSNAEFAAFVADTSYVTTAEQPLDPKVFPDLDDYSAGSMVFRPTDGPVDLRDWRAWWTWVPGAFWRAPRGLGSDLAGLDDHPVVQVSFDDARAYADWAGKELPTEAEWEHFARGGLQGAVYAWGDDPRLDDQLMANTWQATFRTRTPAPGAGAGRRQWGASLRITTACSM